jgi:hypothetical protein
LARPYCTGTEATIPDAGEVRCMRYFYRAEAERPRFLSERRSTGFH